MTFLAAVLAASTSNSAPNNVEPGVLGFLVVAGIGVALVFLLRSMNKQFRKLPPPQDPDEADSGDDAADTGAGNATAEGATAEGATAEGATRG